MGRGDAILEEETAGSHQARQHAEVREGGSPNHTALSSKEMARRRRWWQSAAASTPLYPPPCLHASASTRVPGNARRERAARNAAQKSREVAPQKVPQARCLPRRPPYSGASVVRHQRSPGLKTETENKSIAPGLAATRVAARNIRPSFMRSSNAAHAARPRR